jgi:hypothetical protein
MTPQRVEAKAHADRIRVAGARLRAEIRMLPFAQARALVASLLEAAEPPAGFVALKVLRVLQFLPKVGEYHAIRLLQAVGVFQTSQTCRVRDLTERQRLALAGLLREDADRWSEAA